MDQAILIQAELLDEALGRVANLDSQFDRIITDVKRSAVLLNNVHDRLKLIVAGCGEAAIENQEPIPETVPD